MSWVRGWGDGGCEGFVFFGWDWVRALLLVRVGLLIRYTKRKHTKHLIFVSVESLDLLNYNA